MIQAVVLDLDGTLLNTEHEISSYNYEVIQQLKAQNIAIFLATGRSFNSMRPYYQQLKLNTPAICYNGAKIVYSDGTVTEFPVAEEQVKKMIDLAHVRSIHMNIYQDEVWYVEDAKNEESQLYHQISGLTPVQRSFDTLPHYKSTKVLYVSSHEVLLTLQAQLHEIFGQDIESTFSKPYFLEILQAGVHKGSTVKKVMQEYGIELKNVIAFGDQFNDMEMLQTVGIGIAMENAVPKLKEVAVDIAQPHNKSGVGVYLQRYLA